MALVVGAWFRLLLLSDYWLIGFYSFALNDFSRILLCASFSKFSPDPSLPDSLSWPFFRCYLSSCFSIALTPGLFFDALGSISCYCCKRSTICSTNWSSYKLSRLTGRLIDLGVVSGILFRFMVNF